MFVYLYSKWALCRHTYQFGTWLHLFFKTMQTHSIEHQREKTNTYLIFCGKIEKLQIHTRKYDEKPQWKMKQQRAMIKRESMLPEKSLTISYPINNVIIKIIHAIHLRLYNSISIIVAYWIGILSVYMPKCVWVCVCVEHWESCRS